MTEILAASSDLTPVTAEASEGSGTTDHTSKKEQLQRASLRTAVSVLAAPVHYGMAHVIEEVAESVRRHSGIGTQAQTSIEGSVRVLTERSMDSNLVEVSGVAESLLSQAALRRVGIMPVSTVSVMLSTDEQHVLGEHMV
eukprot:3273607-Amphidinium_carterae.1